MEGHLKLRLQDSTARQSLTTALSPFHQQTHTHHDLFFDGAAVAPPSSRRKLLRLRFFGDNPARAPRCVASLITCTAEVVENDDDGDEKKEEEVDPQWGRMIWANPGSIGSWDTLFLRRVKEQFGGGFVCLGGFQDVRRVYEVSGLRFGVDETSFEFGKLYEVECESCGGHEVQKVKDLIEGLLKDHGVAYAYSPLSKLEIFRAGKLPLTVNVIGNDAVTVSSKDVVGKPLWQYVTKLQKFGGGGNISFRCNYCHGTYTGSYSRVKAHLLKIPGHGIKLCSTVTEKHVEEMKRLVDGTELRAKKVVPLDCRWPSPPCASSESSSEQKAIVSIASPEKELYVFKRRKKMGDAEKAAVEPAKEHLDREIARMFFSSGLPFNLTENPYFKNAFTYAATNILANYVPPSRSDLIENFLEKERLVLDTWVQFTKRVREEKGVSIICSGWTYPQQSFVNIMMVAGVPLFLKAVNSGAEQEDKCFISNMIKEVIRDVGPSNVVQVITENTSICREAGWLIQEAYPNVFWTPCVSHTLDLALRKILFPKNATGNTAAYREFNWITEVVNCIKMAKDFIVQHISSLSTFVEIPDLMLLDLSETQQGYLVALLRRFMLIKGELQSMVMNERWSSFGGDDMGDAQLLKAKLSSNVFWGKIRYILSFTEPIYNVMKIVNSGRCCLHLMYEMWDTMKSKVKAAIYYHELKEANEESVFWSALHHILRLAWAKVESPIFALAHSLNPRYSCKQWFSEDPNHLPPHKDDSISRMRTDCLERYFPNEEERERVNLEFDNFFESKGRFSEGSSHRLRYELNALEWWANFGAFAPSLQTLAFKLLSQPCSSWCSDPNWGPKCLGPRGNSQIDPQLDQELMFVHMNLKAKTLLQTISESGTWEDLYGNSFDPESNQ